MLRLAQSAIGRAGWSRGEHRGEHRGEVAGRSSVAAMPRSDGGTDARTRVNVIYVGGTVALLLPFLETLLRHTDWAFRLVLNGCANEEQAMLESVAADHADRVELLVHSTSGVSSHGEVLDQLIHSETSPYFCFVDSDIFAHEATDFSSLLPGPDESAICSCLPIWLDIDETVLPDGFRVVAGEFLRSSRGDSLGCSFAAAYRTSELRAVFDTWDVSFRASRWGELTEPVREELTRQGLRRKSYDTAKVVNLLLQFRGAPITYRDLPSLVHIGALSGITVTSPGYLRRLGRLARVPSPLIGHVGRMCRGLTIRESRSFARIAARRAEMIRMIEWMQEGTARFENAPAWFDRREVFDITAGLFGPIVAPLSNKDPTAPT